MKTNEFFAQLWARIRAFFAQQTPKSIFLMVCGCIVLIAVGVSLCGAFDKSKKHIERKLYGEEIGENGLRYKRGVHIYNPANGEVLVDSIDWLYVAHDDTIGILAKNHKRAYINLNTAKIITSLDYNKAWIFSCERGVMVRNDTVYIFRPDGSVVNPNGFKYRKQYEMLFYADRLVVNVENDLEGLIDTAAQWVLPPQYKSIEIDYAHKLYNTRLDEQCIVYDYDLHPLLQGNYKSIDVDWSEGLIATEYNGIQHLFSYEGKLLYQVIFKRIEALDYNTGRKDAEDRDIYEETDCFVYVDYNDKKGLMDKHYKVLTPPLFHDIEAQTRHTFFASFGEYSKRFGTLIDDHGKAIR